MVRYYVFSIDRRLDLPYLTMEFVTGGTLVLAGSLLDGTVTDLKAETGGQVAEGIALVRIVAEDGR